MLVLLVLHRLQPPSGGCVLKPTIPPTNACAAAATFGWLCVETNQQRTYKGLHYAATFGWLCVETFYSDTERLETWWQPPSGGCVLKLLLIV